MELKEKIQNKLDSGDYGVVDLHNPEWDNYFDEEGNYIGPDSLEE